MDKTQREQEGLVIGRAITMLMSIRRKDKMMLRASGYPSHSTHTPSPLTSPLHPFHPFHSGAGAAGKTVLPLLTRFGVRDDETICVLFSKDIITEL